MREYSCGLYPRLINIAERRNTLAAVLFFVMASIEERGWTTAEAE
jgi:hypothetical protein